MLIVEGVSAGYGRTQVLWDLSLKVDEGEFVALVGANGAGKTTLLRTISGALRPTAGHISFMGKMIEHMSPNHIVDMGLSHIPESRRLFTEMSIRENLEMGAYPRRQLARTLSGGEQQMLAMGRGLMSEPTMCIIDEPSNGLAPLIVAEIFQILKSLHNEGITILLVEQNVRQTLSVADRAYVLENGHLVLEGACSYLRETDHIRKAYLAL